MLDLEIVLARCAKGGVPSSLIYSIAEIFEDTQYRAQRNIQMKEFAPARSPFPTSYRDCRQRPAKSGGWARASARRTKKFFAISAASVTTTSSSCATKA